LKARSTLQKFISLVVIIHLIGCTTLHPIDASPDELQYKIRHENIINIHDWVRVITEEGKEYRFQITKINETVIQGDDVVNNTVVSVPIDSIAGLETQDINKGRTSLLFGLPIAAYVIMMILLVSSGTGFMP
jgi:hypothetical protein